MHSDKEKHESRSPLVEASLSAKFAQDILELLWDYLPDAEGHEDCKATGWGPKTKFGLITAIENIMLNKK